MTDTIERINRQWIKDTASPAIVLGIHGADFLTTLAALRWASKCGPGPERRRHGGYAYERITSTLPSARSETILHKKELLALIDGLEHFAMLDDETGQSAKGVLLAVRVAIQAQGKTRSIA